MTGNHPVALLDPLVVGGIVVLCTIFIHALALAATVNFFLREKRLGHIGRGLWIDLAIVVPAVCFAFLAHLVEIALWAKVFLLCGEFRDFGTACYHSAVNYTTLGYGDIIMSPAWRLLGPLEAADGALMFGVSTAMVFAVTQRLLVARFGDLKS